MFFLRELLDLLAFVDLSVEDTKREAFSLSCWYFRGCELALCARLGNLLVPLGLGCFYRFVSVVVGEGRMGRKIQVFEKLLIFLLLLALLLLVLQALHLLLL